MRCKYHTFPEHVHMYARHWWEIHWKPRNAGWKKYWPWDKSAPWRVIYRMWTNHRRQVSDS